MNPIASKENEDSVAREHIIRERLGKPGCKHCKMIIKSDHVARWASSKM
jgi:hypothetical protein